MTTGEGQDLPVGDLPTTDPADTLLGTGDSYGTVVAENAELKARVDELETEKEDLLGQIGVLKDAAATAADENVGLKALLAPFAIDLDFGIRNDERTTITVPAVAVRRVNAALE
jgi:hypothetical protein